MGRSENRDSRCVNRDRSKSRRSISPRILSGSAARGGHRSTVTVAAGATLPRNCQSQPKMRRRVSAVIRLGFIIRASACTPAPFHRLAGPDKTKRIPRLSILLLQDPLPCLLAIILFCEITYFPRLKGKRHDSLSSSTRERIFFTNVKEVSSDRDFERSEFPRHRDCIYTAFRSCPSFETDCVLFFL